MALPNDVGGESVTRNTTPSTVSDDFERGSSRLSSALHEWYPGMQIKFNIPKDQQRREPRFSGRLGKEPRIKRTFSLESIITQLSLLTCSMKNGELKEEISQGKRRKGRRKKTTEPPTSTNSESKWIAFANRRKGLLDRLMITHNAHATGTFNMDQTHLYQVRGADSAYDLMDDDEKTMLYKCAFTTGVNMPKNRLRRSGSTGHIAESWKRTRRNTLSAGGKRLHDKEHTNFCLPKDQLAQLRRNRSEDVASVDIALSSVNTDIKLSDVPSSTRPISEQPVKIWQKDDVETSDLKRELSTKVRDKLLSTHRALRRMTAKPEYNRQCKSAGSQRFRISPHLSRMISEDIRRRMGRPRHQELKERDLMLWNHNHKLDRSHRNLKVFNWLHSLEEDQFDMDVEPVINDSPPDEDFVFPRGALHIEACDDPDEKPLYARAALKFVERVHRTPVSAI